MAQAQDVQVPGRSPEFTWTQTQCSACRKVVNKEDNYCRHCGVVLDKEGNK